MTGGTAVPRVLACSSDRMWDRLARNVMGRADLADSYPRTEGRVAERELMSHPMEEVVELCTRARLPSEPINLIAEIFEDPHFAARGAISGSSIRCWARWRCATFPHLSETPAGIDRLGPVLGDSTTGWQSCWPTRTR